MTMTQQARPPGGYGSGMPKHCMGCNAQRATLGGTGQGARWRCWACTAAQKVAA